MDQQIAIEMLQQTGELLDQSVQNERTTIILSGGIAVMVAIGRSPSRFTHDCDVVASEPDDGWARVLLAARRIGIRNQLSPNWLNRDSAMYAHYLPLGWRTRCVPLGVFGPLEVLTIGRQDLMAMKLMGSPSRPQDLEDILELQPAIADLDFLEMHLDRLVAESLANEAFDAQRIILAQLRAES